MPVRSINITVNVRSGNLVGDREGGRWGGVGGVAFFTRKLRGFVGDESTVEFSKEEN